MSWKRGGISCPGGGGGGLVNGIHCCPRGVNYTHPVLRAYGLVTAISSRDRDRQRSIGRP